MTIPKFNEIFGDVLVVLAEGEPLHRKDLRKAVTVRLKLTEEELAETLSGGSNKVGSRIHWAAEFLAQAGAIYRPKRGYMQITDLGRSYVAKDPFSVTLEELRTTDGMKAWKQRSIANRQARQNEADIEDTENYDAETEISPLESIDNAINLLNSALAEDLLQRIREESPEFLERLVLKLLHAMGYGASTSHLEHTGTSGDEGIDGIIHLDQLGVDRIYVQAKRYQETGGIGRPAIQSFVGALEGKRATRGVFITTSYFSKEAKNYVQEIKNFSVVLIDGEKLAALMLANGIGVETKQTYNLLVIDENFFFA
ncbi:MAG: restriction endonuclease [Actinobacteria bacterium]|nr:restriction endonuclease [Actinomycetota bacterium]